MTWRKLCAALSTATMFAAAYGAQTTAIAGVDKATLLAGLRADQSTVRGWVLEVGQMSNLGQRAAILGDLSAAYSATVALYSQTSAASSLPALNADSALCMALHAKLMLLEGPKVRLASRANNVYGRFNLLLRAIQLSGGLDPRSPIHPQTLRIANLLSAAKSNVNQAMTLLAQSTLNHYPGNLGVLVNVRSLIDQAAATLVLVDHLAFHLANTATAARYVAANGGWAGEFSKVTQPGVFFVIRAKADTISASVAERSAIAGLTALVPTLRSQIAAAAASHHDITHLNAALSDLTMQLASANGDIGSVEAKIESMTSVTAAQGSQDTEVILGAMATLNAANSRLTTARHDATLILAASE